MSKEYIERDKLIWYLSGISHDDIQTAARIVDIIHDYPAADVEPVVPAHWEHNGSEFPDRIICSNCKRRYDMMRWEPKDFERCPHCGAHMDERSDA